MFEFIDIHFCSILFVKTEGIGFRERFNKFVKHPATYIELFNQKLGQGFSKVAVEHCKIFAEGIIVYMVENKFCPLRSYCLDSIYNLRACSDRVDLFYFFI